MSSWVEVSLNTPAQLSLPLYLPDDETFASFWPGDNASLLAALQNVLRQEHSGYIYLWAREGAGRSHLLHAACAELSQRGDAVGYVPLDKRTWFVPEVLDGMEHLSLVCIYAVYDAGSARSCVDHCPAKTDDPVCQRDPETVIRRDGGVQRLTEDVQHLLRWSANARLTICHHNGALHQFRVFNQRLD